MRKPKKTIKIMIFDSDGKDNIREYDESFFAMLGEQEIGMEIVSMIGVMNNDETKF